MNILYVFENTSVRSMINADDVSATAKKKTILLNKIYNLVFVVNLYMSFFKLTLELHRAQQNR